MPMKARIERGEPYIAHPLFVFYILCRTGFDEITLAAGLNHDSIEDTNGEKRITIAQRIHKLNPEVLKIVLQATHTPYEKGFAGVLEGLGIQPPDDFEEGFEMDPRGHAISVANMIANLMTLEGLKDKPYKSAAQRRFESIVNAAMHRLPSARLVDSTYFIANPIFEPILRYCIHKEIYKHKHME